MLAISYSYRKNKGDGFEMKKRIISYRLKVDPIHYALLYARKWSAEDVCPVWSDIGADT